MQTKKTTKSDLKKSKSSDKENNKVVVKRRKVELKPTKASAVAIATQANRAKKQALIDKMASSNPPYKKIESSDTKIPLWVWVFFGCSLLLFCVSFYKAIIYPQLDGGKTDEVEFLMDGDDDVFVEDNYQNIDDSGTLVDEYDNVDFDSTDSSGINIPVTAVETIEEFFSRLSDRNFDGAFDLMIPVLRNSSEIREHFTSFRMNPFLDGIEGGRLFPTNFQYIKSPSYGKDVYNFDLSYSIGSDWSKYDETWEFTVNMAGNEPKISSIRCVTPKCSYHPIFWPENFGLMR